MPKLGVNIDHIATVRQQRRELDPDPISAIPIIEKAGADSIVAHLREDRRHILDRDIVLLRRIVKTKFNMEMSLNPNVVKVALRVKPDQVTLVPEKRRELTTEGGLDVVKNYRRLKGILLQFNKRKIVVSLFVDPSKRQIDATHQLGIKAIELHTGRYATAKSAKDKDHELKKLSEMTAYARSLGLHVFAGHGLKYHNTKKIAQINGMEELNIGHSIISRSLFVGLAQAVREMKHIAKSSK
jgi:pyridoxine 5-phosphate synthase